MIGILDVLWYRTLYRPLMRLAHRYNWHYAPPIYPDGDTQLWCRWCGFRETINRSGTDKVIAALSGAGKKED